MSRGGAFKALSLAIVKGFVRDRTSVFFALIFPLMFLVLFGGLFADQTQSKVDMIQVGDVALIDDLPDGAKEAFDETFEVEHSDDLDDALSKVRKGDADVAVEMQGDTLVAHYTQTDQVKAGDHRRAPFGPSSTAPTWRCSPRRPASSRPTTSRTERVEDDPSRPSSSTRLACSAGRSR